LCGKHIQELPPRTFTVFFIKKSRHSGFFKQNPYDNVCASNFFLFINVSVLVKFSENFFSKTCTAKNWFERTLIFMLVANKDCSFFHNFFKNQIFSLSLLSVLTTALQRSPPPSSASRRQVEII